MPGENAVEEIRTLIWAWFIWVHLAKDAHTKKYIYIFL